MSNSSSDDETRSSLSSVLRGASLFFVGRLASKALKFVLNLLLTRGLGAALYGIYAYSTTVIWLVVIFAQLGASASLLRFVPAYEDDPQQRNRYLGLAYLTALAGSILLGAALYILAPFVSAKTLDNPLFVDVLRIFALVLPFRTVIRLTNAAYRGLERLEYQILVDDVTRPVIQIAVVAIALFLGYSLLGVVVALAIGVILVCLVTVTLLYERTPLRPTVDGSQSRVEIARFYNYSIPLTFKNVGMVLYKRVDILMVGFFLTEAAVGIYRVSVIVASLIALPLSAFNQLFPSVASRLYSNERTDELETVYEIVTRWTLTVALLPALVSGLYSAELLAVFGTDFTDGALVLTLFTMAQLTNSVVGPSGNLLMMTDHQYLNLVNQMLLGVLNVILNYVFILEFGLIGAALATTSVLALINVLRLAEVWYTEGLLPYSVDFWKPLVAGGATGLVMSTLSAHLQGYMLLVGGTLVGGVVFAALLLAFGIEEHDRDFFASIVEEKLL